MVSIFRIFAFSTLFLTLSACQNNGDLLRSTYFSLAYSKGDALLAANGHAIKINVVTKNNRVNIENSVAASLIQHGPKWLNADYSPQTNDTKDESPYQMKWAFNVPENGNALALCRKNHSNEIELEAQKKTDIVLAAFCLHNKTLTSLRARIQSEPGSDDFSQTIGLIGRKLLPSQNPERIGDCTSFDDCS
ncbi:hypothetical protein [Kiloniella antarctica]|uniref:Lipoprotein n=1 Tax=Kiloniella antarctica TaxID=1550907 RepID=A0ABW5BJ84_9PROT